MFHGLAGRAGEAVKARWGLGLGVNKDVPLSEMTSRIVAICLCDVDGRRSRRGRGGLGGRRMGGEVEAKVQSRGVYSAWSVGSVLRGLLCGAGL
jgi:hypothetical protein